ncbi:MAG TPA: hypothetical protein VKS80_09805, partial [Trinickia sp.]|nr:hypothetical protein [Trinickia sp.]
MTRDSDPASGALLRALAAAPRDAALHRSMADARRAQGDELGALAHLIAAQTLDAFAVGSPDASVGDLCTVATGYFMKGDCETAASWYRLVLAIDPRAAIAYQNLAAIHVSEGRMAEAEACRAKAYEIQRVFVERSGEPVRDVLILCTGAGAGNVPFDALLPSATCGRIKYAIDYAHENEDTQLPPYDLVFNAIGDPDVAAPLADRLKRFAARCERALLNPPAAIERTFRDRLPGLLSDLDGVATAACIRSEAPPASRAELDERLAAGGLALPVLARPAATHGGEGLGRCDSLDALEAKLRTLDG